jgi:ribonuclease VapC
VTDRLYVLDASALLSLLFQEPGADHVEARLSRALVSAVNYHEVLAKLIDRGVKPNEASSMLAELDVDIIAVDREQANIGGAFHAATRSASLSLGDRSCLALAQLHDGVAVTTNQAWTTLDIPVQVELAR